MASLDREWNPSEIIEALILSPQQTDEEARPCRRCYGRGMTILSLEETMDMQLRIEVLTKTAPTQSLEQKLKNAQTRGLRKWTGVGRGQKLKQQIDAWKELCAEESRSIPEEEKNERKESWGTLYGWHEKSAKLEDMRLYEPGETQARKIHKTNELTPGHSMSGSKSNCDKEITKTKAPSQCHMTAGSTSKSNAYTRKITKTNEPTRDNSTTGGGSKSKSDKKPRRRKCRSDSKINFNKNNCAHKHGPQKVNEEKVDAVKKKVVDILESPRGASELSPEVNDKTLPSSPLSRDIEQPDSSVNIPTSSSSSFARFPPDHITSPMSDPEGHPTSPLSFLEGPPPSLINLPEGNPPSPVSVSECQLSGFVGCTECPACRVLRYLENQMTSPTSNPVLGSASHLSNSHVITNPVGPPAEQIIPGCVCSPCDHGNRSPSPTLNPTGQISLAVSSHNGRSFRNSSPPSIYPYTPVDDQTLPSPWATSYAQALRPRNHEVIIEGLPNWFSDVMILNLLYELWIAVDSVQMEHQPFYTMFTSARVWLQNPEADVAIRRIHGLMINGTPLLCYKR